MSMTKNGVYEGEVVALGTGGEGIIKAEGTTAFVPFCLEGESVTFRALKIKDGGAVAYGKAERINRPSPSRAEPRCPLFGKCGGCDLQHMDYPAQLAFKRHVVETDIARIGGIKLPVGTVRETVPCERTFRYRNKAAIPIGRDENGRTVLGFYARRSHRIVPLEDCPIQAEWVGGAIEAVKNYVAACGYTGYDGLTRTGELRQIVVREIKGKFIIALVAARRVDVAPLIAELEKRFENFTFLLNINDSAGNVIFSDKWRICRGEGRFEAEERGIVYSAGAETFLQVNDVMREKLYDRIVEEAAIAGATAVDLYSGGGLLTAMLSKACGKAYGVEAVREASLCADELCRRNGLEGRMINVCGRVEDELGALLDGIKGAKTVVCDPPRKGMERSVTEALNACGAERIVLVSCEPATLARDLGILAGEGGAYGIVSVTPFDMFPQTRHVETLVVLSRKNQLMGTNFPDTVDK